jgi:hypothetical protein
MRLLQQAPSSDLWLRSVHPGVESNLRQEAAARGVAPARVIFARRTASLAEHSGAPSRGRSLSRHAALQRPLDGERRAVGGFAALTCRHGPSPWRGCHGLRRAGDGSSLPSPRATFPCSRPSVTTTMTCGQDFAAC